MNRSLSERLLNMSIPEPNSGCFIWLGATNPDGYGNVRVGSRTDGTRRQLKAHRAAWSAFVGEIPDGVHVLHRCDNPACINPEHLFLGTHTDNMRDMVAKGRAVLIPPTVGQGSSNHRYGFRATHCVHGHLMTPENTIEQCGVRRCRECRLKQGRETQRRYREKRR